MVKNNKMDDEEYDIRDRLALDAATNDCDYDGTSFGGDIIITQEANTGRQRLGHNPSNIERPR